MNKIVKPEDFFEEKAEKLFKESGIEDQKYDAIVNQFDMKHKNGKTITEEDVMKVIQGMKDLHDSVEIHKEAVIAENKAKILNDK
ncbi:hypothetical protein [Hungatella hathewayi]|uniref:hypothetical protein n=1 Tax=Hungatella hathewayi TaxID=154046 RepID=UPI00356AE297